ncbi:MAG: ABC transporter permease [Bacteroidota bacterium]
MNPVQFISEGLRTAFTAIGGSKTRSFLTMLGVATGIFAITSILTLVSSMKSSITENLASLGNTTMFVHNWPWKFSGNDWYKYINRPRVSYDDFLKVKNGLDGVHGVSFEVGIEGQTIQAMGRSVENVKAGGITFDYGGIRELKFETGRFFSEVETRRGQSVCILGYNIAQALFVNGRAVGRNIRVRGKRLRVVGVLAKKGSTPFGGQSEDDIILMPYLSAARYYNINRRFIDKLITIKVENYDNMGYIESETIGLMRASRGLRPGTEDTFSINKQEMVMKELDKVFQFLETGGWIISFFSLLVGGFSIGNIMYISVRERTKEIGIQKSLGATKAFILFQFLAESVMICILGGIIGLMMLQTLVYVAGYFLEQSDIALKIAIAQRELVVGMGLSVGIGLVSGFIPSMIAASVDPVIAIRYK